MATRLESKRNYIVLTDTVSGNTIEYPKARVRYKDYNNTIQFKYIDDSSQDKTYQFSNLVDSDNVAWSDIDTLLDWLRRNTGDTFASTDVGSIDVNIQSSTSPLVIIKATQLLAETTLTTLAVEDNNILSVADATGASVGDVLTIYSVTNNRVSFFNILAISVNDITVDDPIDFAYEVGSFVQFGNSDMSVDGSTTPVIFGIRNPTAQDIELSVDFTRMILSMELTSGGDYNEFGNIPALTNGLVCRFVDGRKQNIFNIKDNREFDKLMYDFKFIDALGGAPDGINGRFTFEKLGSVIRLRPFEDLQFIVQDDLTGLTKFEILLEGAGVTD